MWCKRCSYALGSRFNVQQKSLMLGGIGSILLSTVVSTVTYANQVAQQPEAASQEISRTDAQRMLDEGMKQFEQGTPASLRKSIQSWEKARQLFQTAQERGGLAATKSNIGSAYFRLKEYQKSLNYFNQTLNILKSPLKQSDGTAILGGSIQVSFREFQLIQKFYVETTSLWNKVRPLWLSEDKRSHEAIPLTVIQAWQAETHYKIGVTYAKLRKYPEALKSYEQALKLYREIKDADGEADTLRWIGRVYAEQGYSKVSEALGYYHKVLQILNSFPSRKSEPMVADLERDVGVLSRKMGSYESAIKSLKYSQAIFNREQDWQREALAFQELGKIYSELGSLEVATKSFEIALNFFKTNNFEQQEEINEQRAFLLMDLAQAFERSGYWDLAKYRYQEALELWQQLDDKEQMMLCYSKLALSYHSLGDEQKTRDNISQTDAFLKESKDPYSKADALYNLMVVLIDRGEHKDVSNRLEQFSDLTQDRYDLSISGRRIIMRWLTIIKQFEENDRDLRQNMANIWEIDPSSLKRSIPNCPELPSFDQQIVRRERALSLQLIAKYCIDLDKEPEKAIDSLIESLKIWQEISEVEKIAEVRYQIAQIYSLKKDSLETLKKALDEINLALEITEKLRVKVISPDLRLTYFAKVKDYYDFKINLLETLNQKYPNQGYDKKALETSDRARARSLIELLTESRADVRKGVSKDLLDREKKLQQELNAAEKHLTQLASNASPQAEVTEVQQKIKVLNQAQTQLKDEIRRESPAYAALKYPEPLKFAEIQQQLDPDTVLLQYSLGEERSYLWVVSNTGAPKSYTLDSRAKIEAAANNFRDNILRVRFNRPADINRLGNELRELIIPEAAVKQLTGKRLVIAADGVLHFIPFASLPDPNAGKTSDYIPLLKSHEIVNVPSMSALIALREKVRQRQPAPKKLAILADPVFSPKDDRLQQALGSRHTAASRSADSITLASTAPTGLSFSQQIEQSQSQRVLSDCNLDYQSLRDLPETGETAKQIASLISAPQQITKRLGLEANKEWLMDDQRSRLDQYQMLLLATHGCASSTNPQLSRLFLSRFNEQGQPISDALQLGDIFNLNLSAELVVLSACDTGLGKDLRGEGIIGLTRGFMYAGAERIVTSLWSVSAEQGTPELMEAFFAKMLRPNQPLSPSAALRAAQREVWQKNHNPYYWAAFTLQGEWRSEN